VLIWKQICDIAGEVSAQLLGDEAHPLTESSGQGSPCLLSKPLVWCEAYECDPFYVLVQLLAVHLLDPVLLQVGVPDLEPDRLKTLVQALSEPLERSWIRSTRRLVVVVRVELYRAGSISGGG
jgi:hypothetical protein